MEDIILAIIDAAGLPLIAVLVPVAVAGIKKLLPMLPSWSIPIIAAAGPVAADRIVAALAGIEGVGWQVGLLGLAGIGIREIADQALKALTTPAR